MQKYKQYCPVARASEILADRWTPLIMRELILGSHRFNEIERGLPGISRSLLASRLRDLQQAGVVDRLPGVHAKVTEYHLSEAGQDLKAVIEALGAWGVRWAFGEPRPEELDPALLVWKIHQRINRDLLPERRTVVEFDFAGPRGRRVWLLLEPREVSVCVTPPGFDADLVAIFDEREQSLDLVKPVIPPRTHMQREVQLRRRLLDNHKPFAILPSMRAFASSSA